MTVSIRTRAAEALRSCRRMWESRRGGSGDAGRRLRGEPFNPSRPWIDRSRVV